MAFEINSGKICLSYRLRNESFFVSSKYRVVVSFYYSNIVEIISTRDDFEFKEFILSISNLSTHARSVPLFPTHPLQNHLSFNLNLAEFAD